MQNNTQHTAFLRSTELDNHSTPNQRRDICFSIMTMFPRTSPLKLWTFRRTTASECCLIDLTRLIWPYVTISPDAAYNILEEDSNFSKCKQWLKYGRKIIWCKKFLKINKNMLHVLLKCNFASSITALTALNRKVSKLQKKVESILASKRQRDRITLDRSTVEKNFFITHIL